MPYSSGCSRVWTPTADRHGFVVVYPNGTGVFPGQRRFLAFNAGGCCPPATWNNADDVGFTEAILSVLQEKVPVDVGRIYATGMSNGGMMAHRMAVESHPGSPPWPRLPGNSPSHVRPSRPVSVMEFHSVDDPTALYEGRKARRLGRLRVRTHYPSVQAGIDQWVAHNGCPPAPVIGETLAGSQGRWTRARRSPRSPTAPVRTEPKSCSTGSPVSGHVWPGSPMSLPMLMGRATTLIDANEVMWQFFTAHAFSSNC